jgi:putative peptidoglycan lipid II flippase
MAAVLIAVGNITSRLIGVIREAVFAATFGRGSELAAFTAASTIPTLVYDLLLSGAISAALVPVFSRVANQPEARDRMVSQVLSLMIVVVSSIVLPMVWFAPQLVGWLAGGFNADVQALTTTMVRWMVFAVPCMVIAGVMTAVLQAQQRFVLPAFVTSVFNVGLIVGALAFTPILGPTALAVGMVVGAFAQVGLQAYGMRGMQIRWRTDWRDPAIREMLRLYAPVALGMGFSAVGTIIDRRLGSSYGENVLPTMRYATTLIQFPLGLVAAAVSTAILPTLARLRDDTDQTQFRTTVAQALTVVVALIVPAAVILWLVRVPLTGLILQRNAFAAADTVAVADTLLWYIPGLPAAAIDQILLFACYARGRTLAPNLIQGAAIGGYVVGVLVGLPFFGQSAQTLAFANSMQWITHMLLMAVLAHRMFDLRGLGLAVTLAQCAMAGAISWALVQGVATLIGTGSWPTVVQLLVLSALVAVTSVGIAWQFRITPVLAAYQMIYTKIRERMARSR